MPSRNTAQNPAANGASRLPITAAQAKGDETQQENAAHAGSTLAPLTVNASSGLDVQEPACRATPSAASCLSRLGNALPDEDRAERHKFRQSTRPTSLPSGTVVPARFGRR